MKSPKLMLSLTLLSLIAGCLTKGTDRLSLSQQSSTPSTTVGFPPIIPKSPPPASPTPSPSPTPTPPPGGVAVIKRSPATRHVALLSREQFSGMDSTCNAPHDAWQNLAQWNWDFGDGTTDSGGHITHVFQTAGTFTVTLSIQCADGTGSSTSIPVTVDPTPTFSNFTKYVRVDGHDSASGDNDTNDPISGAYATFERAFYVYNSYRGNHLTSGTWSAIFAHTGHTIAYHKLSDGSHDPMPNFGPLFVSVTGGSAHATISAPSNLDGGEFDLADGRHDNLVIGDSGYNVNAWDNVIYWDSIDFHFHDSKSYVSGPIDDPHSYNPTGVVFVHIGVQLSNSVVTNAGLFISGSGGGTPDGALVYNVDQSGSWRNGAFWSCAWTAIEHSKFHDNGSIYNRDNEIYASAGQAGGYVGFRYNTLKRGVPPGNILGKSLGYGGDVTVNGLNLNGAIKTYMAHVTTDNNQVACGLGGNDENDVTQDVVVEDWANTNATLWNFVVSWSDRISVRNPRAMNYGTPNLPANADGISVWNNVTPGQKVSNFQVINGSFSGITGPAINLLGNPFLGTNIRVENTIFTKPAGSAPFVLVADTAALAQLTSDYNQFYRAGDNADSTNFFFNQMIGKGFSFNDWKNQNGKDLTSQYGDPLFFNPAAGDLALQSGSPAIDHGATLGIIPKDVLDVLRPQGLGYDIGAFEFH